MSPLFARQPLWRILYGAALPQFRVGSDFPFKGPGSLRVPRGCERTSAQRRKLGPSVSLAWTSSGNVKGTHLKNATIDLGKSGDPCWFPFPFAMDGVFALAPGLHEEATVQLCV